MSKENVVEFYEQHVLKNQSLQDQLAGAKSRDEFAQIALAAGSKAGLSFTTEELGAVMGATERKLNPQLSEEQLEGVVGGAIQAGIQAAPTVQVKALPTLKSPAAGIGPGAVADTIGCCW